MLGFVAGFLVGGILAALAWRLVMAARRTPAHDPALPLYRWHAGEIVRD